MTKPTWKEMVIEAITALREKKGSSRQAILKHITEAHAADIKEGTDVARYLKQGILSAQSSNEITGTGLTGRMKLAKTEAASTPKKTAPTKKKAAPKTKAAPKSPKAKVPKTKAKSPKADNKKKPAAVKKN